MKQEIKYKELNPFILFLIFVLIIVLALVGIYIWLMGTRELTTFHVIVAVSVPTLIIYGLFFLRIKSPYNLTHVSLAFLAVALTSFPIVFFIGQFLIWVVHGD